MRKIKSLINSYKKEAFIIVITTTMANCFALFYNYYYKHLIDSLNIHDVHSTFYWLAIILFFQVAVSITTFFVYDFYLKVFKIKIAADLKSLMFNNLLSFPFSRSSKLSAGNLIVRMTEDVREIADYTALYYFMVFANTFRFGITYYLLFKLDIIVGVIVLATIPLYYLLSRLSFRQMEKATKKEREASDKMTHSMVNKLDNLKTVKANGIENIILDNFKKEIDEWFFANKKLTAWKGIFFLIKNFLSGFLPLVIVSICVYRILNSNMTVGTLVAVLGFSDAVYIPVAELMYFFSMKNNLKPVLLRTEEYTQDFNFKKEVSFNNDNIHATVIEGESASIKIKNLSYSYEEHKIFENINLQISGAGLFLLEGLNGKGKTTFLNILSGLITDYTGEVSITVPDKNIKPIVYMIQENQLFDNFTGSENISLLNPKIKNIDKAGFKFKTSLEALDKNQIEYSGGEKRRISFLRAINREANIYFFDEPLENLDTESREIVVKIISDMSKTKMIILVSHENDCFENTEKQIIKLT